MSSKTRVGFGTDYHHFADDRQLFIGGVEIPYERGLEGHSDADVLLHAISDALLGAAGLGDIGLHFPASDPRFEDISSLILLKRVNGMIDKEGFQIGNIDAVVVAEEPQLQRYFDQMRVTIAQALKIDKSLINLKATRTEGLGAIGRAEGMMSQAIVMLNEKDLLPPLGEFG